MGSNSWKVPVVIQSWKLSELVSCHERFNCELLGQPVAYLITVSLILSRAKVYCDELLRIYLAHPAKRIFFIVQDNKFTNCVALLLLMLLCRSSSFFGFSVGLYVHPPDPPRLYHSSTRPHSSHGPSKTHRGGQPRYNFLQRTFMAL